MSNNRGSNKAIYLSAPVGGGNDVAGIPNGIRTHLTWYTAYSANSRPDGGTYYNYVLPPSPLWVTGSTTDGVLARFQRLLAAIPAGLTIDPTKAVRTSLGRDGRATRSSRRPSWSTTERELTATYTQVTVVCTPAGHDHVVHRLVDVDRTSHVGGLGGNVSVVRGALVVVSKDAGKPR